MSAVGFSRGSSGVRRAEVEPGALPPARGRAQTAEQAEPLEPAGAVAAPGRTATGCGGRPASAQSISGWRRGRSAGGADEVAGEEERDQQDAARRPAISTERTGGMAHRGVRRRI